MIDVKNRMPNRQIDGINLKVISGDYREINGLYVKDNE